MESEIPKFELPTLIHAEPKQLHPAIRKVWRLGAVLSTLVMLLFFSIPEIALRASQDDWPLPFPVVGPALALLIGAWSYLMANKQWQCWTYQLRERDLVLSHGVVWRTRRSVARDRIQHVDINSGPLDRRFGLVQVSLYAAGALGSVGSIPGLKPEEAESLEEALLAGRALDA